MTHETMKHTQEVHQTEICQEILVDANGEVHIPWITPRATPLICAIWSEVTDQRFPVQIIQGNIYCG